LNTLEPAEWLNDTILTAYLDLLGNAVYAQNKEDKNLPKTAVFDSHFLNNLGASNDEYDYKNSRGSASKRLRGRCSSDFEVLLFFCNQDFQHYINLAIYPGQRLICVIDSFGGNALKYAKYIFRWLYDEMYFNWRKEANKLFMVYEPCNGWTYRVDSNCRKQDDGHECGVWTIANGTCMMLNLNMVVLTSKVITNFRKLIFARLCSYKHLVPNGEPKIFVYHMGRTSGSGSA
jgi:Ulp1 family protease